METYVFKHDGKWYYSVPGDIKCSACVLGEVNCANPKIAQKAIVCRDNGIHYEQIKPHTFSEGDIIHWMGNNYVWRRCSGITCHECIFAAECDKKSQNCFVDNSSLWFIKKESTDTKPVKETVKVVQPVQQEQKENSDVFSDAVFDNDAIQLVVYNNKVCYKAIGGCVSCCFGPVEVPCSTLCGCDAYQSLRKLPYNSIKEGTRITIHGKRYISAAVEDNDVQNCLTCPITDSCSGENGCFCKSVVGKSVFIVPEDTHKTITAEQLREQMQSIDTAAQLKMFQAAYPVLPRAIPPTWICGYDPVAPPKKSVVVPTKKQDFKPNIKPLKQLVWKTTPKKNQ